MKLRGKVENQKLNIDKVRFQKEIERLDGKEVIVEITEDKRTRSLKQNAYYFGIVVEMLSDELGYTREEVHSILKEMFLSEPTMFNVAGKDLEVKKVQSTTELNTKEFEQYLAQIRNWASAELSCYIPEPNEVSFGY